MATRINVCFWETAQLPHDDDDDDDDDDAAVDNDDDAADDAAADDDDDDDDDDGSMYVSEKLPNHPSPNLTLTLTSHFGQSVRFGEG